MNAHDEALHCAAYAADKKAEELTLLDVRELSSLTDYLLICNGRSDRQVQAIAEAVRLGMKKKHEEVPIAIEGMDDGRWILLDYGNVMVHVFQEPVRRFYDLDGLWAEAPQVDIPSEFLGLSHSGT